MKKIYLILMAVILSLPVFISETFAVDDWGNPQVITADIAIDGPDTAAPTDDIVLGGIDTATTDDIVLGGIDTNAPDEGIIIGGWDSLNAVFSPGGFGVKGEAQDDIFMPGGWGLEGEAKDDIFMPGGWGLQGMDIEPASGEVPSGFGIWWQGVKESADLLFTFNAEEKVQKRLKYAEEKMQMAGALATQVNDPDIQKKIEKLVGKAENHISKIEKTRDKWFDPDSGKSQQLVGNIVRHNLNRDAILDKLETELPENGLDRIQQIREQGLESNKRLMNALQNENIPEKIREHLQAVKDNIEDQAQEVKQFRMTKQELINNKEAGDETADQQLKRLQTQRLESVKNRIQERDSFFDVYRPNPAGDGVVPAEDAASGLPTGKRQLAPQPTGVSPDVIDPTTGVSPDVIDPIRARERIHLEPIQPETEELNTIGDDAQLVE